jgi:hypothetical protein
MRKRSPITEENFRQYSDIPGVIASVGGAVFEVMLKTWGPPRVLR